MIVKLQCLLGKGISHCWQPRLDREDQTLKHIREEEREGLACMIEAQRHQPYFENEIQADPGIYPSSNRPGVLHEEFNSNDSGRGSDVSKTKHAIAHVVIDVPAKQLERLKSKEGFGSVHRETKHFSETTTMHGPKRIYAGKRISFIFWVLIVFTSACLLVVQTYSLIHMYIENPTVSQHFTIVKNVNYTSLHLYFDSYTVEVSFLISDDGLDFPMVTVCNFNPIKKSNVLRLNATGDFPEELLDYIMETNMDAAALYSNSDRTELHVGDAYLQTYMKTHNNFTIPGFFTEVGFDCSDLFKVCSFGGRQFDCCKYVKPVLTNMGQCQALNMQDGPDWMKKQKAAGVNAGLQLIMDAHLDEQFSGEEDDDNAIFSSTLENGFRYFVHDSNRIAYLASEGISVSPGNRVYSALSTNRYVLLSAADWGNCSDEWPSEYSSKLPYTAASCESICNAKFFNGTCGCTPNNYNIDGSFPICTPLQTIICIDNKMKRIDNGTDVFDTPSCSECKIECNSLVYHAYNSYGQEFSSGSLKWLNKKNPQWTKDHMKANFLTINVFFRDLSHTEYSQVKGTSLTELLSNIGGNMGMFLGMSLITITEIILYFSKVSWLLISKKRRQYMYEKKKKEEEHDKEVEDTVRSFKLFRNRPTNNSMRETRARVQALSKSIHQDSARNNMEGSINRGFEEEGRY